MVRDLHDFTVAIETDYQRTQFGGWPWCDAAPVHARQDGRFAKHVDGRVEQPV